MTAAPAFLGCRGDDDKQQKGDNVLQVNEDFVHYSVDDVSKRFKELTGVSLQGQAGGSKTLKILSLPSGRQADQARERYGSPSRSRASRSSSGRSGSGARSPRGVTGSPAGCG